MTAFGHTLQALLNERDMSLRRLAEISHYDVGYLSKVVNGKKPPSADMARRLEEVLEAPGDLIRHVPLRAALIERRGRADSAVLDAVARLRQQLSETLNATAVTASTVDHWRTVADGYGRTYRITAPAVFLSAITEDLAELHDLTRRPLLSVQRRGLCHSTARMSGLLATALVNLGDFREARAWFHTALRAAEESEDESLQAWVMVRQAVSALYWGDPAGAIDLAGRARARVQAEPCVAAAWAPAVLARALAQLGQVDAAREALVEAEAAFGRLEIRPHELFAYGYSEAQLHFYRSNTLTMIGDGAAYEAQDTALTFYGPGEYLDPSLVRVDRAFCLAREGKVEEAAAYTARFVERLPAEHRSPIVISRARELSAMIPEQRRELPEVQSYRQVLQLPADAAAE